MTRSVFVTSAEGQTGKSTVALGMLQSLVAEAGTVGIYRPITAERDKRDPIVELMLEQAASGQDYESAIGSSYGEIHGHEDAALETIVDRYHRLTESYDVVVVLGSDFTDITTGGEAAFNATVAANLGAPVVLVVPGFGRSPEQVVTAVDMAISELQEHHAQPKALLINRAEPEQLDKVRAAVEADDALNDIPLLGVLPDIPLLQSPTVGDLIEACNGTMVYGNREWLGREVRGFVVAAMSMPNVLTRLVEDATVIAPGDRFDILPGLVLAHQSGTFPTLSSIILTGGYEPSESIARLIDGSRLDLPVIVTERDTFDTTARLSRVRGGIGTHARTKVQTALRNFADHVDAHALLKIMDVAASPVVTPIMFGHRLLERARADRKRIVLPEGTEPRILRAADAVLRRGLADLTLLGDPKEVQAVASSVGADISAAEILPVDSGDRLEQFAEVYADLRKAKGMTLDEAREVVTDVSYFGTMMVHLGQADGMVSGSVHTTAHTIKPSFQIIKTRPGVLVVSSVFLMCLADRVLVYGDCAVNPDPTAEQLADIAISSAATAAQFGVEPRVAMLSYSTGSSGAGADVDKVREATELVRERDPKLLVEGPLQYDAAVEPSVAKSKMPDSQVAGRATVLIFPDLNTGNNTYKAVQRSAGAVAIGPVLQGLNKPVNDLSRGALVDDIINTIAITAIQAQGIS